MPKLSRYLTGIAVLATAVALPLAVSAKTNGADHQFSPRSWGGGKQLQMFNRQDPQKGEKMWERNENGIHRKGIAGTVTSISGTTLTVDVIDRESTSTTSYTVDASSTKMMDGLSVANIQVGDKIVVKGSINGTQIAADCIRDMSFLGRDLVRGVVSAVSSSTITITTPATKTASSTTYTVDATSSTLEMIAGKPATSTSITLSDIQVGDHVVAVGPVTGTSFIATLIRDLGQFFHSHKLFWHR